MRGLIIFFLACGFSSVQIKSVVSATDECSLTPVIHVLQYPGCVPKPIPSFACIGKCGSYVQVSETYGKSNQMNNFGKFKVSGSKIWQMERSCNCCQESGEREASVSLFCPKAKQGERKFRKVSFLSNQISGNNFLGITYKINNPSCFDSSEASPAFHLGFQHNLRAKDTFIHWF